MPSTVVPFAFPSTHLWIPAPRHHPHSLLCTQVLHTVASPHVPSTALGVKAKMASVMVRMVNVCLAVVDLPMVVGDQGKEEGREGR